MMRERCDRVCAFAAEHAALDHVELVARVRALEADVDSYRALARQGIQELARLTAERDGLQRQLAALREEYRSYRLHLTRAGAA